VSVTRRVNLSTATQSAMARTSADGEESQFMSVHNFMKRNQLEELSDIFTKNRVDDLSEFVEFSKDELRSIHILVRKRKCV